MTSNYVPCLQNITLAASGTPGYQQFIDLNMQDWKFCRFVTEVSYEVTASTTGVAIDLYGGMGVLTQTATGGFPQVFWGSTIPAQPNAHYGDNAVSVSMTTVTPSISGHRQYNTSFYFDFPQIRLPGLVRLRFTNNDATNAATISLFSDVS